MPRIELTCALTLSGPLLTRSSSPQGHGIDAPVLRDVQGRICIPGTLVKGRLRQAWMELSEACRGHPAESLFSPRFDAWLGPGIGATRDARWADEAPKGDSTDAPSRSVELRRGLLRFDDFVCSEMGDEEGRTARPQLLQRIRIDRQRGSTVEGALRTLEAPFLSGSRIPFIGRIRYWARDEAEADRMRQHIEVGLRWITNLGGERTAGFGRLISVAVQERRLPLACAPSDASPAPTRNSSSTFSSCGLSLKPMAPFCISKHRVDRNLFESQEIIPGGAIKGCLASGWRTRLGLSPDGPVEPGLDPQRPELCQDFEKLRITHGLPASQGDDLRPVEAPLSLVQGPDDEVYDAALCSGAFLLGDPPRAPRFRLDWKRVPAELDSFGWVRPQRQLRVRTAHDRDSRRARDEHLFAYESVVPDGCRWLARVDLSRIAQSRRRAVLQQLLEIAGEELPGLGKSKCEVQLRFDASDRARPVLPSQSAPIEDGLWIVTLQSPALLCDPRSLREASGAEDLETAYRHTIASLSGNSLRLLRHFSAQSMAGGDYLRRRFQGKRYAPYLLTDAGSVFVLKASPGKESQAQDCVDTWLRQGLELPAWARELYARGGRDGAHWSNCPYIPENGYGEIAVNLSVHSQLRPPRETMHAL